MYPATLSKKVISDLLRNDIGFSGAVISDDMQMRAITSKYGLDEAVCLALAAGVDLLIFGNNIDYCTPGNYSSHRRNRARNTHRRNDI